MGLLTQTEMRATPRNGVMGLLSDALMFGKRIANKVTVPDAVPLIGGQGMGDMLVGNAPSEINEWSYGNAPMRINPLAGKTASYVPETKPGRAGGLLDALALAQVPGGKGAMAASVGLLDGGAMNHAATVFHGSPHKFDKFDSSKIGTGEGAQAYGHGLYLAESPDVARSYKTALEGKIATLDMRDLQQHDAGEAAINAAKSMFDMGYSDDAVAGVLQQAYKSLQPKLAKLAMQAAKPGSLYKVDLPDDKIARMLDWDKPLSQQAPNVQQAFPTTFDGVREFGRQARALRSQANELFETEPTQALALNVAARRLDARAVAIGRPDATGRDVYELLMEAMGDKAGNLSVLGMPGARQWDGAKAAQYMRDLGIPGSRYLDGGSRGAGAGSSNYVVFPGEEDALSILERNGQPMGLLGGLR